MINIQAAKNHDVIAITDCVQAAYKHYIGRIGTNPGPMLDDYADIIAAHSVWVCKNEGQIMGLLVLMEKPDGILLDNIAVHPDYQGKGVGKRLMTFAETEAKKRGYNTIQLYTHEKMVENIAIYEKLGYYEFDRRREAAFDRIYMRKSL